MRYHYIHKIFKKNEIDCTESYKTWNKCIKIEKKNYKLYGNKYLINIKYDCNESKNKYLECLKKVDKFEKTKSI